MPFLVVLLPLTASPSPSLFLAVMIEGPRIFLLFARRCEDLRSAGFPSEGLTDTLPDKGFEGRRRSVLLTKKAWRPSFNDSARSNFSSPCFFHSPFPLRSGCRVSLLKLPCKKFLPSIGSPPFRHPSAPHPLSPLPATKFFFPEGHLAFFA